MESTYVIHPKFLTKDQFRRLMIKITGRHTTLKLKFTAALGFDTVYLLTYIVSSVVIHSEKSLLTLFTMFVVGCHILLSLGFSKNTWNMFYRKKSAAALRKGKSQKLFLILRCVLVVVEIVLYGLTCYVAEQNTLAGCLFVVFLVTINVPIICALWRVFPCLQQLIRDMAFLERRFHTL